MKSIIFSVAVLLFVGCSVDYKQELAELGELEFYLQSMENSFESVDQKQVDKAVEAYKHNISQIKKYYNADTVEKEFVQIINKYKGIKKGSKGLSGDVENIHSNLTTMTKQLSNLRADIENGLLNKDSVAQYLANEKGNLNQLNENISNYVLTCDAIVFLDDSLSNKVRGLINGYSKK